MGSNDDAIVGTLRALFADIVQGANSGHPGAPMGMAPAAHVLWGDVMNFDSTDPTWLNRDRFVLSNGHGCSLLYGMLHLCGYSLPMDELKRFRQMGSLCPGHPERGVTPGVEVTSGPLGQGIANAVGMALAQAHLAARFNRPGFPVLDSRTFAFCGDGCIQEGISSEAMSLAGHLGLGGLTVVYDDNSITIDGPTSLSFSEDVAMKARSFGWHTVRVENGDTDFEAIRAALKECIDTRDRPSILLLKTTIAYGCDKAGTSGAHGAPLGAPSIEAMKKSVGLDPAVKYNVPEDVYAYYRRSVVRGKEARGEWDRRMVEYQQQFPQLAKELDGYIRGVLPEGWISKLPRYSPGDAAIATRKASENAINAIAEVVGNFVGGSADLTPSNLTRFKDAQDFSKATPAGRYIRFGVREHAMVAIANGMDAFGAVIPYIGTFLNFAGYGMGALRMTSMSHHGVIFVGTHDSIGVGEDGPTHQPVEIGTALRAMVNSVVMRPADGNETSGAYAVALQRRDGPTYICLTRQNLPQLERSSIEAVTRGAYLVHGELTPQPDLIIIASGSEVSTSIEAAKSLSGQKVAVLSMPSMELFNQQPIEYQKQMLPDGVPVLGVEAWTTFGWDRYSHYQIGMDTYGTSAPFSQVFEKFGITAAGIAEKGTKLIQHFKKVGSVCSKLRFAL